MVSLQYSSSYFLVLFYGENVKSGFLDTIPNGSGGRKAVKDVEVALHSGCIKIICFSGINKTFVIVTDVLKKQCKCWLWLFSACFLHI